MSNVAQRCCTVTDCDAKHYAHGKCESHYRASLPREKRHPKGPAACVVCSAVVIRRIDPRRRDSHCCSVRCRTIRQFGMTSESGSYNWNYDAKQRAWAAGSTVVVDVDRLAVLERDDWRCYLCDVDTSSVTDPFDPSSATVDHVVPLSLGGHHSMANVRCACLGCNCAKAARLLSAEATPP